MWQCLAYGSWSTNISLFYSLPSLCFPGGSDHQLLSAMQETRVPSLGWEDPLEKEMTAHSSILAWKIPWMAEPGRLLSMGLQRVRHNWATSLHFTSLPFSLVTIVGRRMFHLSPHLLVRALFINLFLYFKLCSLNNEQEKYLLKFTFCMKQNKSTNWKLIIAMPI